MKYECPRCKQFTYEKGMSNRGCGWILLIGVPFICLLAPGASEFYGGGVSFEDMGALILISMIIGVIVLLFSFISPQKTIDYKCSNCKFTQKHEM